MMNFTYHTTKSWTVLSLYNLRNLVQTEILKSTLLVYRCTYFAFYLLYFYCSHVFASYPLKTFSMLIPRILATV